MKLSIIHWFIRHFCRVYWNIGDYMDRWHLLPLWCLEWDDKLQALQVKTWMPFGIRIHHIRRSDAGRDLHNHPWWYITIILRGGYVEWEANPKFPWRKRWSFRPAGSIRFRNRKFKHRIEVVGEEGAWTLFIHGRRHSDWGFFGAQGSYTSSKLYKGDA